MFFRAEYGNYSDGYKIINVSVYEKLLNCMWAKRQAHRMVPGGLEIQVKSKLLIRIYCHVGDTNGVADILHQAPEKKKKV